MIQLLTGLPDTVVGIEAVGRVEASDYENVVDPAVEDALRRNDKLRLLYVLGPEFGGFSPGAAWEDARLGIGHRGAWERIAIVTDSGWMRDAVRAFGWMVPGEVRVFPVSGRADATAWVSE